MSHLAESRRTIGQELVTVLGARDPEPLNALPLLLGDVDVALRVNTDASGSVNCPR